MLKSPYALYPIIRQTLWVRPHRRTLPRRIWGFVTIEVQYFCQRKIAVLWLSLPRGWANSSNIVIWPDDNFWRLPAPPAATALQFMSANINKWVTAGLKLVLPIFLLFLGYLTKVSPFFLIKGSLNPILMLYTKCSLRRLMTFMNRLLMCYLFSRMNSVRATMNSLVT